MKSSKQKQQYIDANGIEAITSFGKAVGETVSDTVGDTGKDFWRQLLGITAKSGDLTPGQAIDLRSLHQNQKNLEQQNNAIRPGIDYVGDVLRSGERQMAEMNQELKQQVQNIIVELQQLASATKVLEQQITQATGHTIVKPGKYHQTFLTMLLSLVRETRMQVENSGAWLQTMQSKKGKKQDYWGMFKQHGTSFGLSGERSVATQTS